MVGALIVLMNLNLIQQLKIKTYEINTKRYDHHALSKCMVWDTFPR